MGIRPAGAKTGEGIEPLHDVSERAMLDHSMRGAITYPISDGFFIQKAPIVCCVAMAVA